MSPARPKEQTTDNALVRTCLGKVETGFPKKTCDSKDIQIISRFHLIGKRSSQRGFRERALAVLYVVAQARDRRAPTMLAHLAGIVHRRQPTADSDRDNAESHQYSNLHCGLAMRPPLARNCPIPKSNANGDEPEMNGCGSSAPCTRGNDHRRLPTEAGTRVLIFWVVDTDDIAREWRRGRDSNP
jgi:hypothetical protein